MLVPSRFDRCAGSCIKLVYGFLLPAFTAVALLYVSPRIGRSWLSDSASVDLVARLLLAGYWGWHFLILSDRRWIMRWLLLRSGDDEATSGFRVALAFLLPAVFSYASVRGFFPNLESLGPVIAFAYGGLSAFPVWVVLKDVHGGQPKAD